MQCSAMDALVDILLVVLGISRALYCTLNYLRIDRAVVNQGASAYFHEPRKFRSDAV